MFVRLRVYLRVANHVLHQPRRVAIFQKRKRNWWRKWRGKKQIQFLKISTTVTVPAAPSRCWPTLTPWYMALVHINLQGLKVGLAGFDEMIRPWHTENRNICSNTLFIERRSFFFETCFFTIDVSEQDKVWIFNIEQFLSKRGGWYAVCKNSWNSTKKSHLEWFGFFNIFLLLVCSKRHSSLPRQKGSSEVSDFFTNSLRPKTTWNTSNSPWTNLPKHHPCVSPNGRKTSTIFFQEKT